MSKTFYFHIGLHKTATTFLQKKVFPECNSLFFIKRNELRLINKEGPFKGWKISRDFEMGFARSPEFWLDYGDQLIQAAIPEHILSKNQNVLISSEGITGARIFLRNTDPMIDPFSPVNDPHLLIFHFRNLRKIIAKYGFDNIKIILTIRRQDYWFASNYSQFSHLIPRASQLDFETQVEHMINPEFRYYWEGIWGNYKLIRDCVLEITGKGNYLILPHELLVENPSDYLHRLADFVDDDGVINSSIDVLNKNSTGENEWRTKKRMYYFKPYSFFDKYDTRVISFGFGKENSIVLSPHISNKVIAFFKSKNQQLDQDENLNLNKYGYYQKDPPLAYKKA